MTNKSNKKFNLNNYKEIMRRIEPITGIKNASQLSKIIEVPQPTVNRRKNKNKFEIEWAYILGKQFDLQIEWILTGQGPQKLNEEKTRGKPKNNFLHLVDEWLQELTKTEPHRADWFQLQFEDSFPGFKKWVQYRESRRAGEGNTDMDSKVA